MFQEILKGPKKPKDYVEIESKPQTCTGCRWRIDGVTCDAFPDGIPTEILLGLFDHHAPYASGELDDGGLQFQPE